MPALTAPSFMAPSVKSLLSTAQKEFQGEGAAFLEQRMSLEITISVLQKKLVGCWHLQGEQQGMFPLQRNQKQVKDLFASPPSSPLSDHNAINKVLTAGT